MRLVRSNLQVVLRRAIPVYERAISIHYRQFPRVAVLDNELYTEFAVSERFENLTDTSIVSRIFVQDSTRGIVIRPEKEARVGMTFIAPFGTRFYKV